MSKKVYSVLKKNDYAYNGKPIGIYTTKSRAVDALLRSEDASNKVDGDWYTIECHTLDEDVKQD